MYMRFSRDFVSTYDFLWPFSGLYSFQIPFVSSEILTELMVNKSQCQIPKVTPAIQVKNSIFQAILYCTVPCNGKVPSVSFLVTNEFLVSSDQKY